MAVVLMVKGTIQYGRLKEFSETVALFLECRRSKGWGVPEALYGLAGPKLKAGYYTFLSPDGWHTTERAWFRVDCCPRWSAF